MRALRIISVAIITAVVGGALGIFCGDYTTRMLRVSDMEGGRGMLVVFVIGPLAFIFGGIVGLIVGVVSKRPGFLGFMRAQVLSLLIVGGIAGFFTGILYLGSDKPPKIDGKNLTLDFELRIPSSIKIPEQPDGYAIRVSLYESNRENHYGFIDWNSIVRGNEQTIIAGHADLMTHSSNRSLLA